MKQPTSNIGINIAGVSKESVQLLRDTVLDIVMCPAADKVKEIALKVLYKGVNTGPTSISGCHVQMGGEG